MTRSQCLVSQRWVKHLAGFSVTLICLIVFIRQVNFSDLLEAFSSFKWRYLIWGVVSLSLGYAMRIYRWSIMLKTTEEKINFAKCSAPFLSSIALNNVLPLRLGDVLRALVFPNSMGIAKTIATSSLIVERLIDLISLLACFAVGLYAIQTIAIPYEIKSLAVTLAVIGGIALSVGFFFSEKLAILLTGLAEKKGCQRRMGMVYKSFGDLCYGFNAMSRPKVLFAMLVISLFVWIGEAGLFYFVLLGVGVESTLIIALFVMSFATLSTLIPSSPGYVGPFHLAAFTAISLMGGAIAQAGSYAVIVHMALWLPTTVAGALAIWIKPDLFRMVKSHAA
jgi:uncharacterized protein (TIRG00374 family)